MSAENNETPETYGVTSAQNVTARDEFGGVNIITMKGDEQVYLVCDNCGGVFDSIASAFENHETSCSEEPTFQIMLESEAF